MASAVIFVDLRRDGDPAVVTSEEIDRVAKTHHLVYYETSSLTQSGLKACLDEAVRFRILILNLRTQTGVSFGGNSILNSY